MATPIQEVREQIKDEHFTQNLLAQHESLLQQVEEHQRTIRAHEGTISDHSNLIAKQKREIQALQTENGELKRAHQTLPESSR